MYGNILYGGGKYADTTFGIFVAEVGADISRSTVSTKIRMHGALSAYPSFYLRDTLRDTVVDLTANEEVAIPKIGIHLYGSFDEFGLESVIQSGIGIQGRIRISSPIAQGLMDLAIRLRGNVSISSPDDNAVAWSKIGEADFTIGRDNIAGKIPLPWKGYTYNSAQLGETGKIIIYGVNGISKLTAHENYFGEKQIFPIGIKSKHAMVATLAGHFFVSKLNELLNISNDEKISLIGYKEFLSAMSSIVMSYDNLNDLIYICDGTYGYVYSIQDNSLTEGDPSITGIFYQDGTSYIVGDDTIAQGIFSLTTDVYDCGTRKDKTIKTIEVETDYTGVLEVGIDFKTLQSGSFSSTPWVDVVGKSVAYLPCYGNDFRFKVRAKANGVSFNLYSIKVNGFIHGFSFLDTITVK